MFLAHHLRIAVELQCCANTKALLREKSNPHYSLAYGVVVTNNWCINTTVHYTLLELTGSGKK